MSIAELPTKMKMTFEEFMALPEDGIHRELIRGELREMGMTVRNIDHTLVEGRFAQHLNNWRDNQPRPRGQVHSGEVGFRLAGAEDTAIGIDVAYVSAEQVARREKKQRVFVGPPVLAIEILSPSDTLEDIADMVALYEEYNVVCWLANPYSRTVIVHRPGERPEMLHEDQELVGDPYLPGFRVHVAELFAD